MMLYLLDNDTYTAIVEISELKVGKTATRYKPMKNSSQYGTLKPGDILTITNLDFYHELTEELKLEYL